jgi:TorA maturation chaperone TorD
MTQVSSLAEAEEPDSAEAGRARVYALLGALLARPPDEALLGTLRQIPAESAGEEDPGLAAAWAMLRRAAEQAEPAGLSDEYQELFIGIGRGELLPYGSWYMTGFLMERPLAELRQDLRALGLERRAEVREPEDHAGALCETMSLLAAGVHALELERQRAFYERHIDPWMGRFFADLVQARSARFYRAVGLLGERFLEVEREYLAMPA